MTPIPYTQHAPLPRHSAILQTATPNPLAATPSPRALSPSLIPIPLLKPSERAIPPPNVRHSVSKLLSSPPKTPPPNNSIEPPSSGPLRTLGMSSEKKAAPRKSKHGKTKAAATSARESFTDSTDETQRQRSSKQPLCMWCIQPVHFTYAEEPGFKIESTAWNNDGTKHVCPSKPAYLTEDVK